jgi:drug/metabolite transporter (DMT)-like permease
VSRVAHPSLGYALTLAAAAVFAVNGTVSTLAIDSPGRLRITWREVPFLAVFGVVGVALTQFLYYLAIGRMPVGIALVFEMTAPVVIALYVWLVRREEVRGRLWTPC